MAAAALTLGRIDQRWLLRVLLFLAVTVAAAAIDLTNTALGRALLPAFDGGLPRGRHPSQVLPGAVLFHDLNRPIVAGEVMPQAKDLILLMKVLTLQSEVLHSY